MASLSLRNLTKRYASGHVLRDITLDIPSGEFFSILGPSGCGKTTLLRMIAGFEPPTSGSVLLDEKDMTGIPPQDRGIAMVFQNYALFPHMTVFQNVAFGLVTRRRPAKEIRSRVMEALESVRLSDKADARVPQLSGGEQQRVAVARALAVRPAVLLFDEPLSNLDVALRLRTREEIRLLQAQTRITTVYVTHDQAEAMSLSDRVAVMQSGVFEQVGTPEEIYQSPASTFVARFLGGANIVQGRLSGQTFVSRTFTRELPPDLVGTAGGEVSLAIKPESLSLSPAGGREERSGVVLQKEYLGFTTSFLVRHEGIELHAAALSSAVTRRITVGQEVSVEIDWSGCSLFPGEAK